MELNCKGLFCPEPIFKTKMEMSKLQLGERLTVISDDPDFEADIVKFTYRNGHKILNVVKKDNGDIVFLLER